MGEDYRDRLARGEPRAMVHAYGHPGALQRACTERDEARAALQQELAHYQELSSDYHALRAEVERLRTDNDELAGLVGRNRREIHRLRRERDEARAEVDALPERIVAATEREIRRADALRTEVLSLRETATEDARRFREAMEREAALRAEVERLHDAARLAYESLLGDTDHSAWHSGRCWRMRSVRGRGWCVCGLSAALAILRDMWDTRAALPREEDDDAS